MTKIEWTEWSPFATGVTPLGKRVERWLPGATNDALTTPLRRRAGRHVVLCCDLFHEDFKEWWIYLVLAVMGLTYNTATTDEHNIITSRRQRHTYQVLTQRSSRMRNFRNALAAFLAAKPSTDEFFSHPFTKASQQVSRAFGHPVWMNAPFSTWPWISDGCPGLWLGVSAERQQEADERIPDLLATPAAVRFVSAEPLLGPVDLTRVRKPDGDQINALRHVSRPLVRSMTVTLGDGTQIEHDDPSRIELDIGQPSLDWVICGGESGRGARPMHPDWARSLRDQCAAAAVPFFFKQWGECAPDFDARPDDATREHRLGWPPIARLGKARAGRLLDGEIHDAMPGRTNY